jgi:hypothetical protein
MTYECCSGCHDAASELLVRKMENNTPITELHFERCSGKNIDHISVVLRRLYVMSLIQQNMMIADMGTIVVLAVTSTGNNVYILTVSVYLVNEPLKRTHNGKGG